MTVAPFLDKRASCNVMPGFKTNAHDLKQIFSSWFWNFLFRQRECLGTFQRNVNMHLDQITCVQAKFQLECLLFSASFQVFSGTLLVFSLTFHTGAVWLHVVRFLKCLSPGAAKAGEKISQHLEICFPIWEQCCQWANVAGASMTPSSACETFWKLAPRNWSRE